MPNLTSWSRWRLAAVWAAWILFVVLALVTSLGVVLWRVRRLESTAPTRLPAQGSDFAISFVGSELRWAVMAVLMPPVLLTAAWLWQRHRGRGAST
jgi:uncharacterized SAM-binding protein YcdF (DUF218 family)